MSISIVSGVGQCASYLIELLLENGDEVIAFSRRTGSHSTEHIDHLINNMNFKYLEGDVTDELFIWKLINDYKPDKFFNSAAQSHVATSFNNAKSTFDINTIGVLNVLEAIRTLSPMTKFLQFSTSEMFGSQYSTDGSNKWQDENTSMIPNSPYAVSKKASFDLIRVYREGYNLWASSIIMFNSESPRRGEKFVTQKIIKWLVKFQKFLNRASHPIHGLDKVQILDIDKDLIYSNLLGTYRFPKLRLGNLDAFRSWTHAKDTMKALILMSEQEKPQEFVVGMEETYSVRDFLTEAFNLAGIKDWSGYVMIDPEFFRPVEVEYLKPKCDKIKDELGWSPKVTFQELVKDMYEEGLRRSSLH